MSAIAHLRPITASPQGKYSYMTPIIRITVHVNTQPTTDYYYTTYTGLLSMAVGASSFACFYALVRELFLKLRVAETVNTT